jgi:hypothetical protein
MERLIRRIRTLGGPRHVRALRSDGAAVPETAKGQGPPRDVLCPSCPRLAYKIEERNLNF